MCPPQNCSFTSVCAIRVTWFGVDKAALRISDASKQLCSGCWGSSIDFRLAARHSMNLRCVIDNDRLSMMDAILMSKLWGCGLFKRARALLKKACAPKTAGRAVTPFCFFFLFCCFGRQARELARHAAVDGVELGSERQSHQVQDREKRGLITTTARRKHLDPSLSQSLAPELLLSVIQQLGQCGSSASKSNKKCCNTRGFSDKKTD